MISGYTISRDCILNDYCIEATIRSMLPICDEVVVCDAMSQDETRELVLSISDKVRVVDHPRMDDVVDKLNFHCLWTNAAREHCKYPFQFHLEADQVIGEESYEAILDAERRNKALWFKCLNFIKDTTHLIPVGEICGHKLVRTGPTSMFMPSDCPGLHPREVEYVQFVEDTEAAIFHYGYLRNHEAFVRKNAWLQTALLGDKERMPEWDKSKPTGEAFTFKNPMGRYFGKHPQFAKQWLSERGYSAL